MDVVTASLRWGLKEGTVSRAVREGRVRSTKVEGIVVIPDDEIGPLRLVDIQTVLQCIYDCKNEPFRQIDLSSLNHNVRSALKPVLLQMAFRGYVDSIGEDEKPEHLFHAARVTEKGRDLAMAKRLPTGANLEQAANVLIILIKLLNKVIS